MKRKLLPVIVMIVIITGVLCSFVFYKTIGKKKINSENGDENEALIVSITSNSSFFKKAKKRTLDAYSDYTLSSQTPFEISAGVELWIEPERMEDEQIFEPYVLIVPEEMEEEKVVYFHIDNDSFVKEIELPASCQNINIDNCSGLERVSCSSSVYSLTINSCANLVEFIFPEECYIPDITDSFENCTSLENIILPDSLLVIEGSFQNMDSLNDVGLNDGLQKIRFSFTYCSSLGSVKIPDSVTTIENGSFSYCDLLTSVTLYNGLETISNSFKYCPSLETLDIPDSVTLIDGESFTGCDNLTLIVGHDTAAEEYAIENDIPYQYRDE